MSKVCSSAQRGATAIEFAFVFSVLFGMFWAIITYAMPFFLYQVMNQAASESVRYATRINPELADSAIESYVETYLWDEAVTMLPDRYETILADNNANPAQIAVENIDGIAYRTLSVTLTYPGCSTAQQTSCLVPALNLAGMSIPNLGPFTAVAKLHMDRE